MNLDIFFKQIARFIVVANSSPSQLVLGVKLLFLLASLWVELCLILNISVYTTLQIPRVFCAFILWLGNPCAVLPWEMLPLVALVKCWGSKSPKICNSMSAHLSVLWSSQVLSQVSLHERGWRYLWQGRVEILLLGWGEGQGWNPSPPRLGRRL